MQTCTFQSIELNIVCRVQSASGTSAQLRREDNTDGQRFVPSVAHLVRSEFVRHPKKIFSFHGNTHFTPPQLLLLKRTCGPECVLEPLSHQKKGGTVKLTVFFATTFR